MRPNRLNRMALGVATSFAILGILTGCGEGDDSAPSSPAPPAAQSESIKPQGATGPASADDKRPAAPDDTISDRPGRPKDKVKKRAGVSGGISPAPASP